MVSSSIVIGKHDRQLIELAFEEYVDANLDNFNVSVLLSIVEICRMSENPDLLKLKKACISKFEEEFRPELLDTEKRNR